MRQRQAQRRGRLARLILGLIVLLPLSWALGQDDQDSGFDDIAIPETRLPLCFGFSGIDDLRALAVCDALRLDQTVRARELSEQWLREEPNSAAAQFALAEVLLTIEGNMARALFHLNKAEELTGYQSMEEALQAGNLQWHYLTLSQLSYVHQLMGDQLQSLAYLESINRIYGQDVESFRGWPLIKLQQYEAARASANAVLESSTSDRERARAWNTLCAVELASLRPLEDLAVCDMAVNDDGSESVASYDTVYLTNSSEVALSLLRMDDAEDYLDRATRYLNPDSVADPWIYMLYLKMNQSRFDEAREALDRMMIWRDQQEPIVSVMNRAEHFLVSASFLLLAGYAEDAVKLTSTALNQPDRNGSYSADDAQKDSFAALLNMMANATQYQARLEEIATLDRLDAMSARLAAQSFKFNAWRAGRRAASLFAEFEVLQNRLRPYAPLDVHIPEWVEPEIIGLVGTGVMRNILQQAQANGAFQLNAGYYHAYATEIAALENRREEVIANAVQALSQLPQEEALLRGRVAARLARALYDSGELQDALTWFEQSYRLDPSLMRRLGQSIPVILREDGSDVAAEAARFLARSPRFEEDPNGLLLELSATPDLSACLKTRQGEALSCYTMSAATDKSSKDNARELVRSFHTKSFGLGYDISLAQRSILLGSSVILSSQSNSSLRDRGDTLLDR